MKSYALIKLPRKLLFAKHLRPRIYFLELIEVFNQRTRRGEFERRVHRYE